MSYHDRLEEYINKTKNINRLNTNTNNINNNINNNLKDDKFDNSVKIKTHRNKQESSQFSCVDIDMNMNTFLIASDINKNSSNKTQENIHNYNLDYNYNYNNTLSIFNQHKPNFTESIAYNTRNYSTIVKDCLNFDEINNINVNIFY
jgi:hypothetical protein